MSMDDLLSIAPHDEALMARVTALLDRLLTEAEYIMEYGSTTQRVTLITKALPAILKSFDQDENAQMAQLRTYLDALNASAIASGN